MPRWLPKDVLLQHGTLPKGTPPEMQVKYGVPHTEEEFFKHAVAASRPLEREAEVPDNVKQAVLRMLVVGPQWGLDAERRLLSWQARAEELKEEEKTLHESLDESVGHIAREKKISLLKEMLRLIGYPGLNIAELLAQGFPLVGTLDRTGVFEVKNPEDVVRGADVRWLYRQAREAQENATSQCEGRTCDDILKEVYHKTAVGSPDAPSEKAKGWLKGPFTRAQLDARYGSPLWVPSLRFGTDKQLDKQGRPRIRAIDDLSAMFPMRA